MFWGFMTTESNNGEILRLLFLIDFGTWNQLTKEHLEAFSWGIGKVMGVSFQNISDTFLRFVDKSFVNPANICLPCETS